jgi:hypothetical protein
MWLFAHAREFHAEMAIRQIENVTLFWSGICDLEEQPDNYDIGVEMN